MNLVFDGGLNWQSGLIKSSLIPNNYDIKIRDAAYPTCIIDLGIVTISQPNVLFATASHVNVSCNGANDGTITISGITGGYGTYHYSLNNGLTWASVPNTTSFTLTGKTPIAYDVLIRDAANTSCIYSVGSFTITQPDAIVATVSHTNVSCNSANDGTITIGGIAGGYGTYDYTLDNGLTWLAVPSTPSFTLTGNHQFHMM